MNSEVPQGCRIVDAQESRIQFAKRSDVVTTVMKGLRFADIQESCFEAWKRSYVGCAAQLYGLFADAQ